MLESPWLWLVAVALWIEFFTRWPNRLPHPVVLIGRFIGSLEQRLNTPSSTESRKKALGALAMLIVISLALMAGLGLQIAFAKLSPKWAPYLCAGIGVTGLAAGSLFQHVKAIYTPLALGDLGAARYAVSMIVGRDTQTMSTQDVATAALESLAESFNDGVVAPVFWFCIGGLPGLFAYKAINTADSMIGHMEPRFRYFGWAAAKIDDLANWIPARIAGVLIALAAAPRRSNMAAFQTMIRDAGKHASPNAGWTEAAMAGALGIRLGGLVHYDGIACERPHFGDGPPPTHADLAKGLRFYVYALGLLTLGLIIVGALWLL